MSVTTCTMVGSMVLKLNHGRQYYRLPHLHPHPALTLTLTQEHGPHLMSIVDLVIFHGNVRTFDMLVSLRNLHRRFSPSTR